jgi:hypothetical protein
MTPLTREFMRGRFDALAFGTKTAQDLFESYLSKENGSPEKKTEKEKLLRVLHDTRTHYDNLLKTLTPAFEEDE